MNTLKTEKEVNKIFSTINHSQFRKMSGNRPIHEPTVISLMKEIKENGQHSPISINSQYEIIDGQHRLEACRRLNIEVKFFKTKGDLSIVNSVNNHQRSWKPVDFIESYISLGNEHYSIYKEFQIQNPYAVQQVLFKIFDFSGHNNSKSFASGEFVVNDIDEARKRAEWLRDVNRAYPLKGKRGFALALMNCYTINGFDPKRMLEKIKNNSGSILNCPTLETSMKEIERLYNYHTPNKLAF